MPIIGQSFARDDTGNNKDPKILQQSRLRWLTIAATSPSSSNQICMPMRLLKFPFKQVPAGCYQDKLSKVRLSQSPDPRLMFRGVNACAGSSHLQRTEEFLGAVEQRMVRVGLPQAAWQAAAPSAEQQHLQQAAPKMSGFRNQSKWAKTDTDRRSLVGL